MKTTFLRTLLTEFRALTHWAFCGQTGGAGTWQIYAKAKRHLGRGEMAINTGMKLSLHTTAASAALTVLSTRDVFSSIGNEIGAVTGYTAGGKAITATWTVGASAKQIRFSYQSAGLVFTATVSALTNVRYAVIRKSVNTTTSGYVLCYCALSTAQFTITVGNTLTIIPNASGVFTLA